MRLVATCIHYVKGAIRFLPVFRFKDKIYIFFLFFDEFKLQYIKSIKITISDLIKVLSIYISLDVFLISLSWSDVLAYLQVILDDLAHGV